MKVLFATTNIAKVKIYGEKLIEKGIEVITLKDIPKTVEVDESGKEPVDNAILKARCYYEIYGLPTIALDDGLFFNNIPSEIQPGTHIKRVNGKTLNETEMVHYYQDLVNKYGVNNKLSGYYLKGIAVIINDELYTTSIKKNVFFTSLINSPIKPGYPLDSLLLKSDSKELSEEEKGLLNVNENTIVDFIYETINNIGVLKK